MYEVVSIKSEVLRMGIRPDARSALRAAEQRQLDGHIDISITAADGRTFTTDAFRDEIAKDEDRLSRLRAPRPSGLAAPWLGLEVPPSGMEPRAALWA